MSAKVGDRVRFQIGGLRGERPLRGEGIVEVVKPVGTFWNYEVRVDVSTLDGGPVSVESMADAVEDDTFPFAAAEVVEVIE
jgi:hypothetical protein